MVGLLLVLGVLALLLLLLVAAGRVLKEVIMVSLCVTYLIASLTGFWLAFVAWLFYCG